MKAEVRKVLGKIYKDPFHVDYLAHDMIQRDEHMFKLVR